MRTLRPHAAGSARSSPSWRRATSSRAIWPPAALHTAIAELKRRYSTRPGDADAALIDELGLFDYLSRRFAVYGTPAQCLAQMLTARAAGLRRVMFTVSLAADPVATVELFGSEVLPALR